MPKKGNTFSPCFLNHPLDTKTKNQSMILTISHYSFNRKVDGHYPDILPAFATDQIVSCGVTLGPQEPIDYPAQYWFDDHFPIYDVETNTKTIT